MPENPAGLVRVSDVLQKLATAPELPPDVRQAIQAGIRPPNQPIGVLHHPACSCLSCHRYFRTVP